MADENEHTNKAQEIISETKTVLSSLAGNESVPEDLKTKITTLTESLENLGTAEDVTALKRSLESERERRRTLRAELDQTDKELAQQLRTLLKDQNTATSDPPPSSEPTPSKKEAAKPEANQPKTDPVLLQKLKESEETIAKLQASVTRLNYDGVIHKAVAAQPLMPNAQESLAALIKSRTKLGPEQQLIVYNERGEEAVDSNGNAQTIEGLIDELKTDHSFLWRQPKGAGADQAQPATSGTIKVYDTMEEASKHLDEIHAGTATVSDDLL